MKRVVVTGGAGFIGSNLVKMLLREHGCEVTVLDNLFTGSRRNLQDDGIVNEIEFIGGNVLDTDLLKETLRGKDTVFHLAAVTIMPTEQWPRRGLEANAAGTYNVLEAALQAGIERVIYGSTSSVYGNPQKIPIGEEDGLSFLTFYAAGKYAGESCAQVFCGQYGLPVTVVRYSNVYGYNQRPDNPYTGVIARFIDSALQDETLTVYGDGRQTRDFTFVDDACRGTILAALNTRAVGRTYNLGTGLETAVNKLAGLIIDLTGSKSKVRYDRKRLIDNIPRRVLKIERAKNELGYIPGWTFREGLKATIAWYVQAYPPRKG